MVLLALTYFFYLVVSWYLQDDFGQFGGVESRVLSGPTSKLSILWLKNTCFEIIITRWMHIHILLLCFQLLAKTRRMLLCAIYYQVPPKAKMSTEKKIKRLWVKGEPFDQDRTCQCHSQLFWFYCIQHCFFCTLLVYIFLCHCIPCSFVYFCTLHM